MKRKDLKVGDHLARTRDQGRRYAQHVIVLDTEPWDERRRYYGRMGTVRTGEFFPLSQLRDGGRARNRQGVACAVRSELNGWVPAVVQLRELTSTWADFVRGRDGERLRQREQQEKRRQLDDRAAELPAELNASRVTVDGRVTVNLEALLKLLNV